VPALLDLAQDAVTLDGLAEAGDQVFARLAVPSFYLCHMNSFRSAPERTSV